MSEIEVKIFDKIDCLEITKSQRKFAFQANNNTSDQIWLCNSNPIITAGIKSKFSEIQFLRNRLASLNIDVPVKRVARGGHFTYHGPGQIGVLCTFNLKRWKISAWSEFLEDVVIDWAKTKLNISNVGHFSKRSSEEDRIEKMKTELGCYLIFDDNKRKKFSSIGFGYSGMQSMFTTWGTSINVNMDLSMFNHFNPCNLEQEMVNLVDVKPDLTWDFAAQSFASHLIERVKEGFSIKHPF